MGLPPNKKTQSLEKDRMNGKNLEAAYTQGQNPGPQNLEDLESPYRSRIRVPATTAKFTSDEVKQVPLVPPGARLEQGAVYLDLRNSTAGDHPRDDCAAGEYVHAPNQKFHMSTGNHLIATSEASAGKIR